MKTRTPNATLALAIAGLALALTPIASLADGTKELTSDESPTPVRTGPGSLPSPVRHISADYNRNGTIDTEDLFDYLTGWFAGKPAADTNLNGVLEIQDVLDYVNLWFNGYGQKPGSSAN